MFQCSSMGTGTYYNRAKCTRILNECQTSKYEYRKTKYREILQISPVIIRLSLLTNKNVSSKVIYKMCTSTYSQGQRFQHRQMSMTGSDVSKNNETLEIIKLTANYLSHDITQYKTEDLT